MNRIENLPEINRIQMLARQAGAERSLYLGEAIGNALAIAWNALGSLGALISRRRNFPLSPARGSRRESPQ